MKYYLGIDLGGTNIAVGVVNENYEIVASHSMKTGSSRPAEEVIDDMVLTSKEALKKANLTINDVEWVGIGCPGTANRATGTIVYANNLGWYDVPVAKLLEEKLQKKVFLDNDANAAAYGEYIAGSAKEADISVMVTLGTGVGGGIVINNQIYSGSNFAGAELGHSVIKAGGRQCTCGRKGCLETYASATGLITTTKEHMEKDRSSLMWELCGGDINRVNGRTSFDAMRKGDKTAAEVVKIYTEELACGIVNIINTFQPDMLCIGGGISHEGDYLLKPIMEIFNKEDYARHSEKRTKIVPASLGNNAGIIGAAFLGAAK